jgi:cysteine-rich repeat protein
MTRFLILVALVGGCVETEGDLNQGCGDGVLRGSEMCDDGNNDYGDGCSGICLLEEPLDVRWEVTSLAQPSDTASCVPGFETAVIRVQQFSNNRCSLPPCPDMVASTSIHTFEADCALGEQRVFLFTTSAEPVYHVTAALENSAGEPYAESVLHRTSLDSAISEHTIYRDAGYVQLVWELQRAGSRISCDTAGVDVVHITATPSAGGAPTMLELPCYTPSDPRNLATTPPLAASTYTVEVTAGAAMTQISDVTVPPLNAITDLGIVQLEL